MYSWRPRSFLKLITLTSLMAIIARLQANQCVGRAYQHIYVGGPPLPSDEILSSHNVGRSAAAGPEKCFSLCKKEPKCVGFNVRSRINDENCQLTNVTESKNENKPKEGEWTLFRDLEAAKREEEIKKNKECETSPAAKSFSIASESSSVILSPLFTTSAGNSSMEKTLKKSSSALRSVNNEPSKDSKSDLGVEKTISNAPSSSLMAPISSSVGDPMDSQEKASSIQITASMMSTMVGDLGHTKEKTPLLLASSGVMTVVSSPVGDLAHNKKETSVAPSSSLMTLISSPVGDPISSHEKTSSIQPTPTAISSFTEYPDLNKTSSDELSTSIVSQMSTTVDALVTAVGKKSSAEHVATSSTNIQPSSVSKCKPFSTSIQPLSSITSGLFRGVYKLRNVRTRRFMFSLGSQIRIEERGSENGTNMTNSIVGSDRDDKIRGFWQIKRNGKGRYLFENYYTRRYLFSEGDKIPGERGCEGGVEEAPPCLGSDDNYDNRTLWRILPQGDGKYLIESVVNFRYVYSQGNISTGWEDWSRPLPKCVMSDANYDDRALWEIENS